MTVEGEGPDDMFGDEPPGRPAPDPDDRLWRHPSELGRRAAGGAGGGEAGEPGAVALVGPGMARGDGRLVAVAALSGIIGALLAVGVTLWSGWASDFTTGSSPNQGSSATGVLAGATSLGNGLSAMVAGTAPSVVSLMVKGGAGPDDSGSGVVIGQGNLILTARRLLHPRATVTVRTASGREEAATVIGDDPDTGLALLRVGGPVLPVLPLAGSAVVNPGDLAVLIGRPWQSGTSAAAIDGSGGLPSRGALTTLTSLVTQAQVPSVIIGEVRTLDGDPVATGLPVLGTLQVDVPVDDDALGAAVVNDHAELIGITVAADNRAGGSCLATPADVAAAVAGELASTGQVTPAWLGVEGGDADTDTAHRLGLSGGALITDVRSGSPAAGAGVRAGDVVGSLDGRGVTSMVRLRALLRLHHPGDRVTLVLARDGETRAVQVTLTAPAGGADGS